MEEHGNKGGMRFGEIIIILLVAVCLLTVLLPGIRQSRKEAGSTDIVVADLRRIEAAKNQYAADHRSHPGAKVSMKELVKGGYLACEPRAPGNGAFVVGAIGTPAEFDEDGKKEMD